MRPPRLLASPPGPVGQSPPTASGAADGPGRARASPLGARGQLPGRRARGSSDEKVTVLIYGTMSPQGPRRPRSGRDLAAKSCRARRCDFTCLHGLLDV